MIQIRSMRFLAFVVVLSLAVACPDRGDGQAADGAAPKPAAAPPGTISQMRFRVHPVIDEQQGNLVLATIAVPESWKVASSVKWNYQDASHPVRAMARVEAPDGSAWVEYFPIEIFYWLEPVTAPIPIGGRSLGMIHKPGIGMREAMERFVIAPYRGERYHWTDGAGNYRSSNDSSYNPNVGAGGGPTWERMEPAGR